MGCFWGKKRQRSQVSPQRPSITINGQKRSSNVAHHASQIHQDFSSQRDLLRRVSIYHQTKVRVTVKMIQSITDTGKKKINDYVFIKSLGKGTFGKVKLAEKNDEQFAIKILKKSILRKKKDFVFDSEGNCQIKDGIEDIKREISILKKIQHKNIIKLYEVIDNPYKDKIYLGQQNLNNYNLFLVMEYAAKGQLLDWDEDNEKFSFQDTNDQLQWNDEVLRNIVRGAILGLEELHRNNIVHRDIKPQNILIDAQGNVKLADFGVSHILQDQNDKLQHNEGTYNYMAPEVLGGENGGYSGKLADIWSLGVTLYAFVYLQLPFQSDNLETLIQQVQSKQPSFKGNKRKVPEGVKNLIKRMLEKNPAKRITIKEIILDKWINDCSIELYEEIVSLKKIDLTSQRNSEREDPLISVSTLVRIKSFFQKKKREKALSLVVSDNKQRSFKGEIISLSPVTKIQQQQL